MPISFALAHKQRVLTQLKIETQASKEAVSYHEKSQKAIQNNPTFATAVATLENDYQSLSNLPQNETRRARKRELIQGYLPIIEAYEGAGEAYANPVLVQVMIWAFDCGEIQLAERLAHLCLSQDQQMPERFKRDTQTYVSDSILEHANTLKDGVEKLAYLLVQFERIKDTQIHDIIKSKYAKEIALGYYSQGELKKAQDFFNITLTFNPKAPVKTVMGKINSLL